MSKKVFFPTKIKVSADGRSVILFAMVSPLGAARVVSDKDINSAILSMLGREVSVNVNNDLDVRGIFVREVAADGIYLNVRFTRVTPEQRALLESWVEEKGEPPAWSRKFPRIPISDAHPDLPAPFLALVSHGSHSYAMSVRDYTFWGIKLEHVSANNPSIQLGSKIQIDLMNHMHEEIHGLQGTVRHVMENKLAEGGLCSTYGVQLTYIPAEAEHSYRDLILKYCLALKAMFQDGLKK